MDCPVNRIRTRSKRGTANTQPSSAVSRSYRKPLPVPLVPIVTRQRRRLSSHANAESNELPTGSGGLASVAHRGRGRGKKRINVEAVPKSKSQTVYDMDVKGKERESPNQKRRRLTGDAATSNTTDSPELEVKETVSQVNIKESEEDNRSAECVGSNGLGMVPLNDTANSDIISTDLDIGTAKSDTYPGNRASESARPNDNSTVSIKEEPTTSTTLDSDSASSHKNCLKPNTETINVNPDTVTLDTANADINISNADIVTENPKTETAKKDKDLPNRDKETPDAWAESLNVELKCPSPVTETGLSKKETIHFDAIRDEDYVETSTTGSVCNDDVGDSTDRAGGSDSNYENPVESTCQEVTAIRDAAVKSETAVLVAAVVKNESNTADQSDGGSEKIHNCASDDEILDDVKPGGYEASGIGDSSIKARERATSSCSQESDNQSWTPGGGRVHHPSADSDSRSTATTTSVAAGGTSNESEGRQRTRVRSPSGSRSGSRSVSRAEQGTPVRHRSGMDFRVGYRLEARDCMNMWYASRVIQVDWDKHEVLIHFERWNSRFDEWVSMDSPRLRPIARTSARKDRKGVSLTVPKDYKVGEIVLAKWVDCKMYPAKVLGVKPDASYNVVFYDGYKKAVLGINLRKLPPDQVGKVDFSFGSSNKQDSKAPTRGPSKKLENRLNSVGSNAKTEGQASSVASGSPKGGAIIKEEEAAKPASPSKKSATEKTSQLTPASAAPGSAKSTRSSQASGEVSGRGVAGGSSGISPASSKRKKLVVGGIFQAKRHQLAAKTNTRDMQAAGLRRLTCSIQKLPSNSKTAVTPTVQTPVIGPPISGLTSSVESVILVAGESYVPMADGVLSPYHPPKEFMIEEDHNHFKCPVAGCNKSFRKEQLLASHAKHYHNTKAKKAASSPTEGAASSTQAMPGSTDTSPSVVGTSLDLASANTPSTSTQPAVNSERKLITERRRQLLFQRRIESMCKQYQQDQEVAQLASPKSKTAPRRQSFEPVTPATPPMSMKLGANSSGAASTSLMAPVIQLTPIDRPRNNRRHTSRVDRLRQRRAELSVRNEPDTFGASISAVSQPYQPESESKIQQPYRVTELPKPVMPSSVAQVEPPKKRRHRRVERPGMVTSKEYGKVVPESKKRPSHLSQTIGPTDARHVSDSRYDLPDFEEREEMVNCICQQQEEDGLMMQCEVCLAWQHGVCFNIDQEDQVPERYVCFACENPRGLRESFRYRHNQDWFKLGEMAGFRFLPLRDQWPLQSDMLRTHNVAGQLLSIKQVLHGLRCKLTIAKQPQHTSLHLWARPCNDEQRPSPEAGAKLEDTAPCKNELAEEPSAGGAIWNFTDHSYSVNDQVVGTEEVVESGDAYVVGNGGSDGCPMEVAANEVLGGSDVPVSASLLSNGVLGLSTSGQSAAGRSVDCPLTSTPLGTYGAGHRPSSLSASDRQKLKDRCTKKRTKKEVNVVECQLNLLDHVEQTQLALDRRMDELELMLEESNCEGLPPVPHDGKINNENLMSKRLLRAMAKDLAKVQQLSLFH